MNEKERKTEIILEEVINKGLEDEKR